MKGVAQSHDKTANAHDAAPRASGATRPAASADLPTPTGVAAAQESAGNLAIQRLFGSGLLQTKLAVSSPNDPYEQEADRVTERVLSGDATPAIERKFDHGAAPHSTENLTASALSGHTPRMTPTVAS